MSVPYLINMWRMEMAKKYEMYLNYEEFDAIHKDAIRRLNSFTMIACDGYWKGKHMTTILLVYIAITWEKQVLFEKFYKEIVQAKLEMAHYVCSDCQFVIGDPKEIEQSTRPHLRSD